MTATLIEPVARLIEAFARLPGIGPKTAQRLTYHLLRAPDAEARTLAAALVDVRDKVVFCERCFNISDQPLCPICRDPARDTTPAVRRRGAARRPRPRADRASSRASTTSSTARSRRSTASGPTGSRSASCSPGPTRRSATGEPFVEVILATNPTLEGEATAMYLAERLEDVGRRRQPDRPRPAGRRRPRVRRRGDPDPGPPGPAGGLSRRCRNLVFEILLRLAKAGAALVVGTRRLRGADRAARRDADRPSSRSCRWLSGAAFILLVETQPDLTLGGRPRPTAVRRLTPGARRP